MKLIDADAFAEKLRQRIEREAVHHMAVLGDEVLVMLMECEEVDAEAAFWKMIDETFVGCPNCLIKEIAEAKSREKPKTNGDRIRAMTDEELAEFLSDITDHCSDGWECDQCPLNQADDNCSYLGLIKYFKKEVSEDAT